MRISFAPLAIALILGHSLPMPAYADLADAESLGMGGASTASTTSPFSQLRNPANLSFAQGSRWVLPTGSAAFGNNFLTIRGLTGLGSSLTADAGASLFRNITFNQSMRADVSSSVPIFAYGGQPFGLKIGDRPVSLGFSLAARGQGFFDLSLSRRVWSVLNQTQDLTASATSLGNNLPKIQTSLQDVNNTFNQLKQEISNPDFVKNPDAAITRMNELITASETTIKGLDQSFTPLSQDINLLVETLAPLAATTDVIKGQVVADGHMAIGFAGALPVYENDLFTVTTGANAKLLFFPWNMQQINPMESALRIPSPTARPLLPLNTTLEATVGPIPSLAVLTNVIKDGSAIADSTLKGTTALISDMRQLTTDLETLRTSPSQEQFQKIETQIKSINGTINSLSGNIASGAPLYAQLSGLQTSLTNETAVKFTYSSITDVAPLGVGADLGVQLNMKNGLSFGLALENLLVFWPAKEQRYEAVSTLANPQASGAAPTLLGTKDVNYSLSEPFTVRLGGAYKIPMVEDLNVAADIEHVANGRPIAGRFGVEKRFGFFALRAGGQLGGIGSMLTIGTGVRLGAWSLDLGYGSDSPFNPAAGKTASVGLSSSLSI